MQRENFLTRQIHDLVQGSEEWHQFRLEHNGASEAAAMLGLSKKTKRSELVRMKATGIAKEFTAWVQANILDYGHEVEAMARPLVEMIISDDLYPVTCSLGSLSASCDGLTMSEAIAFEHKQWAAALAASVGAGELPEEHAPQCQQVLMVTGAEKLIFVVSDGTEENMVWMWVYPDAEWFGRIRAGWEQFDLDVAAYEHVEFLPAAIAAPVQDLPALSIRVDGALTLNHNLVVFGDKLTKFIADINTTPEDDQAFADAEQAIKVMERAEEALGAAEASALGQISTVDEMVRTVATYKELARKTRLMLEKMVKARKETIRVEIQQAAKDKAAAHITALNARLGKSYMPAVAVDFATAMKGKKTVSSLRDAADTELARFKIEANAIADKVQINLGTLRELAADFPFLFADTPQIVLKAPDDLTALVQLRIGDHQRAEAAKAEALRAKIAEEERIKAEKAAAETVRLAQLEADRKAEEAAATERARVQADTKRQLEEQAASIAAQRAAEKPVPEQAAAPAATLPVEPEPAQRQILNPATAWPAPTGSPALRSAPATPPALRLGQINERIAPMSISVEGLRVLGFEPAARDKAAQLYHEHEFPSICAAMARHLGAIQSKQAA